MRIGPSDHADLALAGLRRSQGRSEGPVIPSERAGEPMSQQHCHSLWPGVKRHIEHPWSRPHSLSLEWVSQRDGIAWDPIVQHKTTEASSDGTPNKEGEKHI